MIFVRCALTFGRGQSCVFLLDFKVKKKPMQRHRLKLPALRLELRHARAQKILSLSCLPFHQAGKY